MKIYVFTLTIFLSVFAGCSKPVNNKTMPSAAKSKLPRGKPMLSSRIYSEDSSGVTSLDVVLQTEANLRKDGQWEFRNEIRNQSPTTFTVIIVTPRMGCSQRSTIPVPDTNDVSCQIPFKLEAGEEATLDIQGTKKSQPVESLGSLIVVDETGGVKAVGHLSIYWPSDEFDKPK